MKPINRIIVLGAVIPALFVGVLHGCQENPVDSIKSHERAIVDFRVDGQIGVPEISRDVDEAELTVYVTEATDLTQVVPDIMVSYNATVTPASGDTVNFAENDGEYMFTVTSESGRTRDWLVKVDTFESNLSGTWEVTEIEFRYRFGEPEDSWGWGGVRPVYFDHDEAEDALGNLFHFTIEGIDEQSRIFGTFVQEPGGDSDADFPDWGEWAYKFDRVPEGEGTYHRDFSTNRLIFNEGTDSEHQTLALRFPEDDDEQTLEIAFPMTRDIDWDVLANITAGLEFWYTLEKVE